MSSDGNVSFATFVYGDDGVKAINDLQNVKLIGFDAGDSIKGATVLSPGFSSQQTLQPVNTFRIDGNKIALYLVAWNDYNYIILQVIVSLQPILVKSVA